ncbi:SKI family SFII helicase [Cryptosporidium ryanae]|uniref:SKI family SFII helicase n=1 Tax=Cryptosporidium ryanae TaxID=515981 RepID=UPI003519F05D|nr:SKI family SFII helicase [Cryptosporidium ryanae]
MDDELSCSFDSLSKHGNDFSEDFEHTKTFGNLGDLTENLGATAMRYLTNLQHASNYSALNVRLNELLECSRSNDNYNTPLGIKKSKGKLGDILKWYFSSAQVSKTDVTPDVSDSENVFVNAEGLIIHLYYSFGFEIDPESTPQTLPYIYLFERFINYLIEAGAKRIILIFLDDFSEILAKINPGLSLLRESLLLHTKLNLETFKSKHFSSWLSEEYQFFLREQEPSIFFLEDGSSITNLNELHKTLRDNTNNGSQNEYSIEEYSEDEQYTDELDISTSLLSFTLEMLSYSNVSLFYNFERKGQKIIAFTYSSTTESRLTELNKYIMRQEVTLRLSDSSDINGETKYISEMSLRPSEYCISNHIGSDEIFILFIKSLVKNSISEDDLNISKTDESIMHNISLILLYSKILLLSGYLKVKKLSYEDRHCISNLVLKYKVIVNEWLNKGEIDDNWSFLSVFKSLESLYIHESSKQLRSLTENINSYIGNTNTNIGSILSQISDLNDPLITEFLFLVIGYSTIKNKDLNLTSEDFCSSLLEEIFGLDENDTSNLEQYWSKLSVGVFQPFFPLSFTGVLNRYIDGEEDQKILNFFGKNIINNSISCKNKTKDKVNSMLLPLKSKFVIRVLSELGVGISDDGLVKGTTIDSNNADDLNEYLTQIIQISGLRDVASWEMDRPSETRPNSHKEYSGKEGQGSKLSAELEKKKQLRDNQRQQQFWFNLGQILAGSDKLQQTIVVNPFHVWNKISDKNEDKQKSQSNNSNQTSLSSKAEEIRRKNESAKLIKMKQDDENQLIHYDIKLNNILSKGDPESFMVAVYDMLIGVPRKTNEFGSFKGLSKSFKLPKSKCKVLLKTIQTCISVIRSFKFGTLPDISHMVKARSATCMLFRLIIETYNQFYKYMDKHALSEIIGSLILLGFKLSAKNIIGNYKFKMESDIINMNENSLFNGNDTNANTEKKKTKNKDKSKDKKILSNKPSNFPEDTNYSEYSSIYNSIKKSFEELSMKEKINMSAPNDCEALFQLRYMGADFERSTGSISDQRVPFNPDYWQKKILDIIDSGDSALVCAPTASGKTFICYYAMEQVLRYDNESVVIFIAPTKALADQVHAEITYRFGSKMYPNHSRISLLCKLNREYSINIPTQCQILITLPFMLELLLMSTSYQQWVSRIKFVIFDEVHCINESDGGVHWERIFQLIPCPYLCLSATIGNPHGFYNWLQRIGKLPSSNVHFISYSERYADLSTYVYNDGDLYPLNPINSLTYDRVLSYGLPGDFYLTPSDCLDFYLSLRDLLSNNKKIIEEYFTWLSPQIYFSGTIAITKRQYRWYLSTILLTTVSLVQNKTITKEMWNNIASNLLVNPSVSYQKKMIELAKKNDSNVYEMIMGIENVKKLLRNVSDSDENSIENSISLAKSAILSPYSTSPYKSSESILKMVRKLQQENLLPCIIFNMERAVVEHLGHSLIEKLTKDHHDKYYGTEEATIATKAINKKRQEQYIKNIQRRDMLLKLNTMSRQQREKQGIVIDESELQALENLLEPIDIAEEYDPEFSFCDRKVLGGREREINDILNSCEGKISPVFIEGLKRGIGIHHDGLSLRYRRAVETLYRMGYLCIIISTRTLALGVNMPCRTTVFINDSITLTPLLYRQASGRAGRRGYDVQGSIVFWDISVGKRNRLLTSELPTIKGNFPVTPTTVLRTFMLFENILSEQSKNGITKDRAVITLKALVKLYRDSLYSVDYNQDFHRKLTAIQFRFAVDLLRRFHVLDRFCGCTGYAGLISHMFEFEGTNLLLSRLIHSGVLFKYLFNEDEDILNKQSKEHRNNLSYLLTNDSIQRLLIILAHIYISKPMTRNSICNIRNQIDKSSLTNLKQKISTGRIGNLLLALPNYIQQEIDEFNNYVFRNTRESLVVTCSDSDYDSNEFCLPLSNHKIINDESISDKLGSGDKKLSTLFSDRLTNESKHISTDLCIQSPFITLFGIKNDDFNSSQKLIYGSRIKLNCTNDLLSIVKGENVHVSKNDDVEIVLVLINSFLIDFYESQRFIDIVRNNSIASSEIFFLIADFKVLLDRFLHSFDLKEMQQYERLNIKVSGNTLEFYRNVNKLTEILQKLYDNYRIIAGKNDA